MIVGILSDSHDNLDALRKAVERFNRRQVGLVIHAGDLVAPFVQRALSDLKAPLVMVFGNNDGERLGLARTFEGKIFQPPYTLSVEGKRVLVLHEPHNLEALKVSGLYDVVIYGHTHEIDVTRTGKTLVINPGECGGWLNGRRTVAFWDTETNEVEIVEL